MTSQYTLRRAAGPADASFIVEMARHACVIEDRPLPDPDDDEVLEMLPPTGVVPIIAVDHSGTPVGAVPALLPPGRNSAFDHRMDAVPRVGEHTDAILLALGRSAEQVAALRAAQAI